MEEVENHMEREILRMEVESRSSNEEFARVAVAVFMSRLDPTMEEIDDVIRDLGVGIRDVEKAMEPMYTTDTTGERSGMGFSFMEAFMDEVQVRSAPGQGTCVIMKKRIGR